MFCDTLLGWNLRVCWNFSRPSMPLGEAVGFDDLVAEDLMVEGVRVKVATPATLFRMKRDTIRAIDRADAEALARKFRITEKD